MKSGPANALNYYVTTFYKFKTLTDPEQLKIDLESKAAELRVKGLIIIGTEGFNATVACPIQSNFDIFKAQFQQFSNGLLNRFVVA
ncbi:MAG: hypothetical protein EOP09_16380, partial [Proteobacteria bacterium]